MTAPLATILQDALGRDYRIEQELEGGGMSRLFVATDTRLGRRVVIKVLPPEFVSEQTTARFRREIDLTVRLQHPHILPILTSGSWEDMLWYITPYIAGESLRARVARDAKLPLDDVIKILRDVSGALAFAHARGIVHRDIKPGNILLAEGHAILADFGIARAVGTSGPRLTGSGMMLGTPAYMAPEVPSDEGADVYALGVVACEMLCGELPRRGATAKEIIAKRGQVAGDRRGTLHDLARLVADSVTDAPHQRVPSIGIMTQRLQALSQTQGSGRAIAYTVLAAAAIVTAAVVSIVHFRAPRLDDDRYVLVTSASADLRAELQRAYADALNEWDGIKLANADGAGIAAGQTASDAAVSAARRSHARNAVAVDGERVGDSIVVRATLYDARGDTSIRSTRVAARVDDPAARLMALRRSINGLLRTGVELPWMSAGDHARPSLAAWREYDAGRAALRRWDLPAAELSFRGAIASAPGMPLAHLWLAKTLTWQSNRSNQADIRAEARRTLSSGAVLAPRDSLRAAVLLALAERDFRSKCGDAERLVAGDSSDLTAWLDLGDCRTADHRVVPDARSRTGWAFESSYESAATAYTRAGDLGPTEIDSPFQGWLLGRLSFVLFTASNHVRSGYRLDHDTVNFAAFPVLDHDTIAFDPFPRAELASGRMQPPADAVLAAVTRNRTLLRQAAEQWVRRAPRSAAAYDSLAAWVEMSGGLATIDERAVPAIDVVRRARQLAKDPTERLHLAVSDVRLLLKSGRFAEARVEAESLLATGAGSHVPFVKGVDGLALLVGRPAEAARIHARDPDTRIATPSGGVVTLPAQMVETDAKLVAYTSLGLRDDTVAAVVRQMESLIDSYFPNTALAAGIRSTIFSRPLIAAYPLRLDLLKQVADTVDPLSAVYVQLASGDAIRARAGYRAVVAITQGQSQGISIDGTFRRAALAVALHDTVGAVVQLDPVLRALPTLAASLLGEMPQVGSLIRALILRSELASQQHDRQTAQQCSRAVLDLWKDADPEMRPVVQEMARLSH